jgi:uncharacterized membrane protein
MFEFAFNNLLIDTKLDGSHTYLALIAFFVFASFITILLYRKKGRVKPLILRTLGILCLLLALTFPRIVKNSKQPRNLAVLVDISDSMPGKVGSQALEQAISLLQPFKYNVFTFGSLLAPIPINDNSYDRMRAQWQRKLDGSSTDITGSIIKAQNTEYDGLVLITDGHQTTPTSKLTEYKIPIFPILVDDISLFHSVFEISRLDLPVLAPPNSKVTISAVVSNKTQREQSDTIVFKVSDKQVCTEPVTVTSNNESIVNCSFQTEDKGPLKVDAYLSSNERARTGYISIETKHKVLVINGSSKDEKYIKTILEQSNIASESKIASPDIMIKDFSTYSTIVLNNVSTEQVNNNFIDHIAEQLKAGTGLFTIGGDRSYGLGGYHKSKLQEIIPVNSLPPQTETKRLSNALVLVIDKSGSMNSASKLDYAKAAALEVVKKLNPDDYIGIVGFDQNATVFLRTDQVAKVRSYASRRIENIFPVGPSNLIPALNAAHNQLEHVQAGRKHIIVISDGEVSGSIDYYARTMKLMRTIGITVSTVFVGLNDPMKLKYIAQQGGGHYYSTSDSSAIPRIFLKDVEVAVGEKTMHEDNYVVKSGAKPLFIGSDISVPNIRGYVKTEPKDNASIDLLTGDPVAMAPLLAHFKFGKGMSVALTTDLNGTWSNHWLQWNGLARLLQNIFKYTSSKNSRLKPLNFDLRNYVDQGQLILDLAVFETLTDDHFDVILRQPSGRIIKQQFDKNSAGHYQARFNTNEAGTFNIEISNNERSIAPINVNLASKPQGESMSVSYNADFLGKLALMSGGKINPNRYDIEKIEAKVSDYTVDLLPYILAFFILCLITETFTRER